MKRHCNDLLQKLLWWLLRGTWPGTCEGYTPVEARAGEEGDRSHHFYTALFSPLLPQIRENAFPSCFLNRRHMKYMQGNQLPRFLSLLVYALSRFQIALFLLKKCQISKRCNLTTWLWLNCAHEENALLTRMVAISVF